MYTEVNDELQYVQGKLKDDIDAANREKESAVNNLKYMTNLYEKANDTISRYLASCATAGLASPMPPSNVCDRLSRW